MYPLVELHTDNYEDFNDNGWIKRSHDGSAYGEPSSAEEQKQCCGFMRRRNLTRVRVEEKESERKAVKLLNSIATE
jgi:hypothetical protein